MTVENGMNIAGVLAAAAWMTMGRLVAVSAATSTGSTMSCSETVLLVPSAPNNVTIVATIEVHDADDT